MSCAPFDKVAQDDRRVGSKLLDRFHRAPQTAIVLLFTDGAETSAVSRSLRTARHARAVNTASTMEAIAVSTNEASMPRSHTSGGDVAPTCHSGRPVRRSVWKPSPSMSLPLRWMPTTHRHARDLDRFLGCYAPDAVIEGGSGQVLMRGREASGVLPAE
jgi:hypothetical protein